MKKEIEVKFQLDRKEFDNLKKQLGLEHSSALFQRTYFFSEGLPENMFLRVREERDDGIVTLKIKNREGKYRERVEYNIVLKDKNEVSKMVEIFQKLGFEGLRILEKKRLETKYENSKIAFDIVPFGYFIEVEAETEEELKNTVEFLNLPKEKMTKETYWALFDKYREERGIKDKNSVFNILD